MLILCIAPGGFEPPSQDPESRMLDHYTTGLWRTDMFYHLKIFINVLLLLIYMIFTKKIFEGKIDESVHNQFTRFGPGTFENRALIKITLSKDKFKLSTSYDLVKDITWIITENFNNIQAKGKLFHGKNKREISKTISGEELKKICEENTFVLLNLDFDGYSVKVGKSLPKPGKALKDNFCKCVLPLKLLNEFIEKDNFKKAEISHTFIIEKINIPDQYKNDFAMARKMAKRKGKIIQITKIDGNEQKNEASFEA